MKKTCKNCENYLESRGWCEAITTPDNYAVVVNKKKDRSNCKYWTRKEEIRKI